MIICQLSHRKKWPKCVSGHFTKGSRFFYKSSLSLFVAYSTAHFFQNNTNLNNCGLLICVMQQEVDICVCLSKSVFNKVFKNVLYLGFTSVSITSVKALCLIPRPVQPSPLYPIKTYYLTKTSLLSWTFCSLNSFEFMRKTWLKYQSYYN